MIEQPGPRKPSKLEPDEPVPWRVTTVPGAHEVIGHGVVAAVVLKHVWPWSS